MNDCQVRQRILVVDDEQAILALLERVLRREGYQVATMHCSDEVVGLMSHEHYHVAVVDVGLRSRNGCRLMQMIRRASPETAIVVMTGYPVEELIRFAREHAQGYLEKPFDLLEFLEVVRSALKETVIHWTRSGEDSPGCHCNT